MMEMFESGELQQLLDAEGLKRERGGAGDQRTAATAPIWRGTKWTQ